MLFDEMERHDHGLARYAESKFTYFNRTARPAFEKMRVKLEEWFAHYPSNAQDELRSRFRSDNDVQHQAALFELFLHELLLSLGCQMILHPTLHDVPKVPDFLVTSPTGERFYIEATTATNKPIEVAAARTRINLVYDVIDRLVKSPNFFLALDLRGAPATPPPAKRLASFLNKRLAELDPDEVKRQYEEKGKDTLPQWTFEHDGWRVEFHPIPKKAEARGKEGVRAIGYRGTDFQFVDHRKAIRDAVVDKAGRYGEFDLPYIVAVLSLELVDMIDVMDALFGKEQYSIAFSNNVPVEQLKPQFSRAPDGVWVGPKGPKYTRVSGVLLVTNFSAWNFPRSDVCLYHNPWAKKPYRSVLTRLPQAIPRDGEIEWVEGRTISDIFGIPESWPGEAD